MTAAEDQRVPVRRLLLIGLATTAMVSIAASASAYTTEFTPASTKTCIECHGTTTPTVGEPAGPHGGYLATTNKCATCHSVHAAFPGGIKLLPAATILGTCETCHDGTGGSGVYGAILARTAIAPVSDHSIDLLKSVPGGDPAPPYGSKDYTFAGESGNLTCTDCHSPHGANVVAAFVGDRARSADDGDPDNAVTSTRLLKKQPNGYATPIANYGSDWCGACHMGRLSGSGITGNHPVESSLNLPGAGTMFYYNSVALFNGATGSMGHTNNGYVMPDPRTAAQTGHDPICQQCHEDPRHVGDVTPGVIDASEAFVITTVDGSTATDRPRFQNFPHESQNALFLVETSDDLCLNCHAPG